MQIVKDSGLRGRGGAGFPTGLKWSFCPTDIRPTTWSPTLTNLSRALSKTARLWKAIPFNSWKGDACLVRSAGRTRLHLLAREFWQIARQLDVKIEELIAAGLLGDKIFGSAYSLCLHTHLGAGAYICGEETALLESIEGKLGQPRLRPPFPAVAGLFGKPTVINTSRR